MMNKMKSPKKKGPYIPQTNVQYLNVDILSYIKLAQSASVKALMFLLAFFLKKGPLLGALFKYFNIWYTTSYILDVMNA